ncbi:hypothetical protein HN51_011873 [Arachis hypogaea]
MEAHKERREQVEKDEGSKKKEDNNNVNKLTGETVTQRVVRENVVSSIGHENERAQDTNDVLAFSRSVHNVDSSLE